MIKASIIIPTKNGGAIFKQVLDKVSSQKLDFDFEIIIIDSGSKDETVAYTREKNKTNTNIILQEIKPSEFGHGKTRNFGASIANGEFIVFITQDALPCDENWLLEMIKPFEISEDIVGVFGKHLPYDDCDIFEKHNLIIHFNNFGQGLVVYKMDDKERYKKDEGYRHLLCFYSDNASAMRKSIWHKIPYDDVDFAEDQLWAKKIIELGYSKAYTSDAVVYHSHNYGFKEMMMRSFDDHKGLFEIYQYVPIKNIFILPLYIIKHTFNDYKHLKSLGMPRSEKKKWMIFSIKKNISKYVGSYFGPKGNNKYINKLFSRELTLRSK
jgi:rhamnosyltransferase